MSTSSTSRRMPNDLPSRAVALILCLISIGFLAHLNMRWDSEVFKTPLILVVVSTILILVGFGSSFNTWRVNASWCPKRTASQIFLSLAAAGLSAACAALTAQPGDEYDSKIRASTVGVQISAAILEFLAAVFAMLSFTGFGRDKHTHAVPAKNHRVSEESV